MDRCKTCKHWKKDTRICTVAYLEKYSGVQHICWDQDGGRHEVSTGKGYGCIHWEGVTKPFFVEKEGDFGGCHNHWRIVHDGEIIYVGDGLAEVNSLCETLNCLWADRDG